MVNVETRTRPRTRFRRNCVLTSLQIVSIGILAVIVSEFLLQNQNTLIRNRKWISGKLAMSKHLGGSVACLMTRPALSRNCLNLGAWHGFQEFLYHKPLDVDQVDFDFRLAPNAYGIFVFDRTDQGFSGIRLSRNLAVPCIYFRATVDGQFVNTISLGNPEFQSGWNHFTVGMDGSSISYQLNGQSSRRLAVPHPRAQVIGFRGGRHDFFVDNVVIQTAAPNQTVVETFRNQEHYPRVLLSVAFVLIVLNAIATWFWHRRKQNSRISAKVASTAFSLLLIPPAAILLATDYFVLSARYPDPKLLFETLATAELRIDIESLDVVHHRLVSEFAGDQLPATNRLLFIGSSQMWGAGVRVNQDCYVDRIERGLSSLTNNQFKVRCYNAGVSGATSPLLAYMYENEWIHFAPKLVVVSLSSNDRDAEQFRASLERIAELNRRRRIKTIFILEPQSFEMDDWEWDGNQSAFEKSNRGLQQMHEVMLDVGSRYDIACIDLDSALRSRTDGGLLWWDYVHMTSYGHAVFAERLLDVLRPIAESLKAE